MFHHEGQPEVGFAFHFFRTVDNGRNRPVCHMYELDPRVMMFVLGAVMVGFSVALGISQ